MVVITRAASNTFVMTLGEKATYVSPEYLLVLYDKHDRALIKFFLTNTSSDTSYEKFTLTEGTDETIPEGDYTYKVYEKANQDDEDIPADTFIVETGILRSLGADITEVEYSISNTNVVYDTE